MTDINRLLNETDPRTDRNCETYEFEAENYSWSSLSEFYEDTLDLDEEPQVIGEVKARSTYFITFKN